MAATGAADFDLMCCSPAERDAFWSGYQWGRVGGLEDGYRQGYAACDDELAALHRRAAAIVLAHGKVPPRDREADRARAAKRDAYWAARRGEVA